MWLKEHILVLSSKHEAKGINSCSCLESWKRPLEKDWERSRVLPIKWLMYPDLRLYSWGAVFLAEYFRLWELLIFSPHPHPMCTMFKIHFPLIFCSRVDIWRGSLFKISQALTLLKTNCVLSKQNQWIKTLCQFFLRLLKISLHHICLSHHFHIHQLHQNPIKTLCWTLLQEGVSHFCTF